MASSTASPRSQRRTRLARRRAPGWLRWTMHLARLLVFICAFQLSSGAHVLVNVFCGANAGCIDTCASPCEDEQDHGRCPVDCPNCSCPHGRLPTLPPSLEPVLPEQFAWELSETRTPYRSGVPPSPPLPSLYRPPRA